MTVNSTSFRRFQNVGGGNNSDIYEILLQSHWITETEPRLVQSYKLRRIKLFTWTNEDVHENQDEKIPTLPSVPLGLVNTWRVNERTAWSAAGMTFFLSRVIKNSRWFLTRKREETKGSFLSWRLDKNQCWLGIWQRFAVRLHDSSSSSSYYRVFSQFYLVLPTCSTPLNKH